MKKTTYLVAILLLTVVWALSSCTADKLPEVVENTTLCDSVTITFDAHVKPMLDKGCNYSGCHDGNNQLGIETYGSMDAARRDYVHERIQDGSMPPSYVSLQLTSAERDSIDCWKKGGYPEN